MVDGAENCANGHPCQVVFTLDEENNIVLQEISGAKQRSEGVLRLTTSQAKAAAEGPQGAKDIRLPQGRKDEFADTIKALASVPGLGFLNGERSAQKANANTGANSMAGQQQNLPLKCRQIEKVMAATLEEHQANTLSEAGFITPAEVHHVCPPRQAKNLISWYQAEKDKHLSH